MTEEADKDKDLQDELASLMNDLSEENQPGATAEPTPAANLNLDPFVWEPLSLNRLTPGGRLFRKGRNVLGVDIGEASIKIVQMDTTKSPPKLYGFAIEEIPINERNKGKPTEEYIVKTLKRIIKSNRLSDSIAVSYLSGTGVFVYSGQLEKVPEDEITENLNPILEDKMTFPLEEAIVKYSITGESTTRQGEQLELTAVAAQKELVQHTAWIIEEMGLQITGLSTPSHSFENLFSLKPQAVPDHVVVINFGASRTEVNYYREGRFVANREISVASRDINRVLTTKISDSGQTVEVTPDKAEALKKHYGAMMEVSEPAEDLLRVRLTGLMRPILEKMTAEMKRSLSFFQRSSGVKQMEKIYIVGGSSSMKHLSLYLKNELDIDVELFPSKRYFSIDKKLFHNLDEDMILNTLVPSCGLFINREGHINLVPAPTRIFSRIASYKHTINLLVGAILTSMLLAFGLIQMEHREYVKILNESEDQLALQDNMAREIDQLRAAKQKYLTKKKLVEGLVLSSPKWEWLLAEISRITPDAIIYKSINVEVTAEGGVLTFIGTVNTQMTRLDKAVSELMEKMGSSPYFQGMELVRMAKNPGSQGDRAEFELNGYLMY